MNSPNRSTSLLEPSEETLTAQLSLERRFLKKLLYVTSIYELIVITTSIIIVANDQDPSQGQRDTSCQILLSTWILLCCFTWLINQTLQILVYKYNDPRSRNNYMLERLSKAHKVINPFSLAVTIWGHILLFNNSDCLSQSPQLFYLAIYLLAHAYLLLIFGLGLFIIGLVCFPCLLRVVRPLLDTNKGLTKETIRKLEVVNYENIKTQREEPSETCVICLETFKNPDKVITLDCRHVFHQNCLTQWLLINDNCPICREIVESEKIEV